MMNHGATQKCNNHFIKYDSMYVCRNYSHFFEGAVCAVL